MNACSYCRAQYLDEPHAGDRCGNCGAPAAVARIEIVPLEPKRAPRCRATFEEMDAFIAGRDARDREALRFIKAGDADEAGRALRDMLSHVTLAIP